jgi:putative flavoprotein involved in K+ transport
LQIAEELREDGREVYWCISGIPCNFRRYAGADFMHWWTVGGIMHREVHDHPWVRAGEPDAIRHLRMIDYPLVSGKGGEGLGHSISLRQLWEKGIVLLGRLGRVEGHVADLNDDLLASVAAANAGTKAIQAQLREIAARFGAKEDDIVDHSDWLPPETITTLDLRERRIGSVIFATGFRSEWPWLGIPDFRDAMGYPDGARGVTSVPGFYFNGLFYLQRLSSTCLCNGGRDAAYIVGHIEKYLEKGHRLAGLTAE